MVDQQREDSRKRLEARYQGVGPEHINLYQEQKAKLYSPFKTIGWFITTIYWYIFTMYW